MQVYLVNQALGLPFYFSLQFSYAKSRPLLRCDYYVNDYVDFNKYEIYAFKFNIQDCVFLQNYAGLKGTALYIN